MTTPAADILPLSAENRARACRVLAADGTGIDGRCIQEILDGPGELLGRLRDALAHGNAALIQCFLDEAPATQLIHDRTALVDRVISHAWREAVSAEGERIALIAVGGYGRGELHPHSDIDLLLLSEEDKGSVASRLSAFVTLLWDAGLEMRQSVRSVTECRHDAATDLTVITTLMESRLLEGPEALHARMQAAIRAEDIWPSRSFFEAKLREQQARHHRYDDTAYKLEPDIKGSPGGLRDIHTIGWIALRHFGSSDPGELVRLGFLSPPELRLLMQGRDFLWRVRFALHALTERHEDRLLFDHQARIAQLFGYQDASYMLAVEQFMQRYYRTVMDLSRLSEMLLQQFQEAILTSPGATTETINEYFQVRNGFLQTTADDVFERYPSALLELFVTLQEHPGLRGVSARTISQVRRNLNLIDDEFRQDPRNHRLFLRILGAAEGVTHELRRMNRYGVLGRYIPAFGRIVGRMQYDLFHVYTVDEHTLFVVSNLRRLALSRYNSELPRCSEIMQGLPSPELAYLGGMFHDIAKGRGGDHSELGAIDAESFCLEHGLSRYDARLVAWLVRHHLSLSLTAQKRDLSDPAVISEFARMVGDEIHLDYLYVLTVCDVRATSPKLWNSWKAQLFEELYGLAKRALRRGLENPIDKDELIAERRAAARQLLDSTGLDAARIDSVWSDLGDEYFLRFRAGEIAWHTALLAARAGSEARGPMIGVQEESGSAGTAVMVYTPKHQYTFAAVTAVLDELGLNIADARIIRLGNGYRLSTFVVLENGGERIQDADRRRHIQRRLDEALRNTSGAAPRVTRRPPRQVRMFSTPTIVNFATDDINGRTVMELVAGDRPGLLCQVGQVLREHEISVQAAKILTVGERAEDVLYITDIDGQPLSGERCARLEQALAAALGAGS